MCNKYSLHNVNLTGIGISQESAELVLMLAKGIHGSALKGFESWSLPYPNAYIKTSLKGRCSHSELLEWEEGGREFIAPLETCFLHGYPIW